jgi:hypothetical protein
VVGYGEEDESVIDVIDNNRCKIERPHDGENTSVGWPYILNKFSNEHVKYAVGDSVATVVTDAFHKNWIMSQGN